jgi:hypothetical protein
MIQRLFGVPGGKHVQYLKRNEVEWRPKFPSPAISAQNDYTPIPALRQTASVLDNVIEQELPDEMSV